MNKFYKTKHKIPISHRSPIAIFYPNQHVIERHWLSNLSAAVAYPQRIPHEDSHVVWPVSIAVPKWQFSWQSSSENRTITVFSHVSRYSTVASRRASRRVDPQRRDTVKEKLQKRGGRGTMRPFWLECFYEMLRCRIDCRVVSAVSLGDETTRSSFGNRVASGFEEESS